MPDDGLDDEAGERASEPCKGEEGRRETEVEEMGCAEVYLS